jgi:hypothetical protein
MAFLRKVGIVVCAAVFAAACQGATDTETTTTEGSSLPTLPLPTTTTTISATTTILEPPSQLSAPEYQIVQRTAGEGVGDELVVLLDPASYETLTDIDIQELIAEIVDLFPPVWTAHIIDDPAAANVVGNAAASEEDLAAIADHYLARLDNGFEITFLGPFAPKGSIVLGS